MPAKNINYFPPFSVVKKSLQFKSVNGEVQVSLTYDELVRLVKLMAHSVPVDEAWYLSRNPDVVAAINGGQIQSARQHWIEFGYFEGRLPSLPVIDPGWYVNQYPDVARGVAAGAIQSPQSHYLDFGYQEGRLPVAI